MTEAVIAPTPKVDPETLALRAKPPVHPVSPRCRHRHCRLGVGKPDGGGLGRGETARIQRSCQ